MYIYIYIYIYLRKLDHISRSFILAKCLQLKLKLFSVSINAKRVVMTFVATVLSKFVHNG